MAGEITLNIDGTEVTTTTGTNVLQAALDAGMYIPYLCYYPGMKSFGACRMCVVSAEQPGPDGKLRPLPGSPASCTTPAADGMVVRTQASEVTDLRRGIMDLLLSEHPHGCLTCHRVDLCGPSDICLRHVSVNDRCVTCPKNERCELKDTVRYLEMDMDTPLTYNNRHLPLKVDDPLWEMDMNLCIVCGRCVRVCDEVRGDNALTFTDRGGRSLIGTSNGTSLLESGCEFCGACIDVCPTGALVERAHKWDKAVRDTTTICPHCPVGCQIKLDVDKRNRLIRTTPDIHAQANRGQVCFKGKFGLEFVNRNERLRKPTIRVNGTLQEKTLTEALDFVSENLTSYMNGDFGMVVSPRGTNEDSYIAQKFARSVMKTNNIDISSNLRPELVTSLGEMLGAQAGTNPIWDLENSKCFLVVSSNITEEQNVVSIPIKKAVKNGASLIVIDSRETELTRYATKWLRPIPGTETALIGGMIRTIVDESLDDHEFLANRCAGVEALKNSLWDFDLIKVSRITSIAITDIQEVSRLLARNNPAAILYALDSLTPELRDPCVRALVNIALVTGNLGNPSSGLYPLYPGANEQGAKDMGSTPANLPGYHPVSDDTTRGLFEDAWDTKLTTNIGISLRDMALAISEGRIKALLVIGDSPNFSNGELADFVDALKGLEFLVVQDSFPSKITETADAVLPSTTFAENQGTYTNMERRVQLLRPAVGARGDEQADWSTLAQIAKRMGSSGFDYHSPEDIFAEITSLIDTYRGISYKRLSQGGLQWPCLEADLPDTPILCSSETGGPKLTLSGMTLTDAPDGVDSEYPFTLAPGRLLHQDTRAVEIEKVGKRNIIRLDQIIVLHEDDARSLGLIEGDWVEVVSPTDKIRGVVNIGGPHAGLVSTTSLFGEVALRLDNSTDPDPILKVPGLPLTPARVEKLNDWASD